MPVIGKLGIKLNNLKMTPRNERLDLKIFQSDQDMNKRYTVAVQSKYNAIQEISSINLTSCDTYSWLSE